MKKTFITLSTVVLSTAMYSQVGINTSTPTAALDIQTKGNTNTTKALKISNSSNIEMVTVTNGGRVGIGVVAPAAPLHVSTTEANGIISERANATNPSSPPYLVLRRNRSTNPNTNGAVATNDYLVALVFSGNTGNGYEGDAIDSNSFIAGVATENFSTTTQGSELRFMTVKNGTASPSVQRMTIANDGNVGIATATPNSTLHIVGAPSDNTKADGIIAPILTGNQLRAKNSLYNIPQTSTLVYITAADSAPAGKTINVTSPGYYYFDGTIWQTFKGANGTTPNYNDGVVRLATVSKLSTNTSGSGTNNTNAYASGITVPFDTPTKIDSNLISYNNNQFTIAKSGYYQIVGNARMNVVTGGGTVALYMVNSNDPDVVLVGTNSNYVNGIIVYPNFSSIEYLTQ